MGSTPTVWLIAAENGALPGGKVGGVGDVVRDLPQALNDQGWAVRVIVPSYGALHRLPAAKMQRKIPFRFAGVQEQAELWQINPACGEGADSAGVEQWVVNHPGLCPDLPGMIYHPDPPEQVYRTEANQFSLFNAIVAAWVNLTGSPPDVLHLHDWHAGMLPFLRALGGATDPLSQTRVVFTIHNLSYQGVRPLCGEDSSLEAWLPEALEHARDFIDPHEEDSINFMAVAIRLSDAINTVSPTYAAEIARPNDPARGFSGGEGMEELLQAAARTGRLRGILNGCAYPGPQVEAVSWDGLISAIEANRELAEKLTAVPGRLSAVKQSRPRHVLLNVGRVVKQKVALLLEPLGEAKDPQGNPMTALDGLLEILGDRGLLIMLGSGDEALEQKLLAIAERRSNMIYLCGYAEELGNLLYENCDLFLMPSSFEPCGISQMLAMRAGMPCIVHAVGGLLDTVEDGQTGFLFSGDSPAEQASEMLRSTARALRLREEQPDAAAMMSQAAAAMRFDWAGSADSYIRDVYQS